MRALQVYLDSSDFSRLSDTKGLEDPTRRGLREYLMARVASGDIEVRISSIHVAEAAPHDTDAVAWAKQRGDLIESLSQGRVVRYFDLIDRGDLAVALAVPGYAFPEHALADNGDWWPDISDLADDVQNTVTRAMREAVASFPRHDRRRIERAMFDGQGHLSESGKKLFRASPAISSRLTNEFPVSEKLLSAWPSLFDQPNAKEIIITELRRTLQDVRLFMEWFCTHGYLGGLGETLRAPIRNSADAIKRLRALYAQAVTIQSKLGLPRNDARRRIEALVIENMARTRKVLITQAIEKSRDWLQSCGVSATSLSELDIASLRMPKIDAMVDMMGEWFLINVTGNRNILESDFGDIAHLCHAPYVDVIRCDAFAWQVCRPIRAKWADTIFVARLEDLRAIIESRL
jgi:hypothetical protein